MDNELLNNTIAKLLALAGIDLFPGALAWESLGTSKCFFTDFTFDFEFQDFHIQLIEEKIKSFLKQDLEIENLEMEVNNAALFLEHKGRKNIVPETVYTTVTLCKIGDFIDICNKPILKNTKQAGFFKLAGFFKVDGKIRIFGVASIDNREVKKLAKEVKNIPERYHVNLGEKRGLFKLISTKKDSGWLWLPEGENLKRNILKHCEIPGFGFVETPKNLFQSIEKAHEKLLPSLGKKFIEISVEEGTEGEGLLGTTYYTKDLETIFCGEAEVLKELIESLDSIKDILEKFNVKYKATVLLKKKNSKTLELLLKALEHCGINHKQEKKSQPEGLERINFLILDVFGRENEGPFVEFFEVKGKEGVYGIRRSLLGSLERFCAIVLEGE